METAAPKNGFKVMLAIVIVFALAAAYGQYQRLHRAGMESISIIPAATISPTPAPEK